MLRNSRRAVAVFACAVALGNPLARPFLTPASAPAIAPPSTSYYLMLPAVVNGGQLMQFVETSSLQPHVVRESLDAERTAMRVQQNEDRKQALPALLEPAWLRGAGPTLAGAFVAQTQRLDIYVGVGTFSPEQITAAAPLFEELLREDERRFGTTLDHRVSLAFYRPAMALVKGSRGLAFTDQARADVYYAGDEDFNRAVRVTAHELAHHLEAQRYGDAVQRRADTVLHEGMATWISGQRWLALCGANSWREHARQLRDRGVPLRLLNAEAYGANNAYEVWASFVDFLVAQYGWERVDALYRSGSGRAPGSADYQGVLGKSLNDVSNEWRAWVDQP